MSNETITYLIVGLAGLATLSAWIGWLVVPAWRSYSRPLERIAASFLTLYTLATLLVLGAAGGALIVYYWDRIAA
jgi:hypothetical protein